MHSSGPSIRPVTLEVVDVSGVEAAPLRDEVEGLVPPSDYLEATAAEGTTVLRYVDGARVPGVARHRPSCTGRSLSR